MKNLLNKTAATASMAILFVVGCVMAGLGLTVVLFLALFAIAMAGLAFLAAPFVGIASNAVEADEDALNSTTAA